MYLISACLAGLRTRYDGTSAVITPETGEKIRSLLMAGLAIPVCPEQLGGLPTPRPQVDFRGGDGGQLLEGKAKAVTSDGVDFSDALIKGAGEVLRLAETSGIKSAILKDGSPSCGVNYVYINGVKTPGKGVTAKLLTGNGIEVITVDSL